MSASTQSSHPRQLFCVMSAQALPYAEKGLQSLFANLLQPASLTVITDGEEDKRKIMDSLPGVALPLAHKWAVCSQSEADERATDTFRSHPNILQFRMGHPCWRKITDPLLFCAVNDEMIILDPDPYFPNRFCFEHNPAPGRGSSSCGSRQVACFRTRW